MKQRRQQMWASGDFHAVATLIQPVADTLCNAVDLQAGWRVLDVATGSGNAAIAAARCGCEVVGIDDVPALLERGRRRVEAEGVDVQFIEGDAEAIPFPDGSFDAVLSVFGSMFAPDQDLAAAELLRVCRPGGRIGLATWTPDGFIGQMLKVVTTHVPPPRGVASPLLWGSETHLSRLFGYEIDTLDCRESRIAPAPRRRVGGLAEGLRNAQIADRLVVSPRTAEHHVAAVLTKLGSSTRRDAARRAADLGLTAHGRT